MKPASRMLQINPEKLMLTKWTAVHPEQKEKHFMVVRVGNPETQRHKIEEVKRHLISPLFGGVK